MLSIRLVPYRCAIKRFKSEEVEVSILTVESGGLVSREVELRGSGSPDVDSGSVGSGGHILGTFGIHLQ